MAESSLDDFFAKKDKSKKSKTKTKFTTTDTIAKKLEEGGVRKVEYVKRETKEKSCLNSSTNNVPCVPVSEQDDDEWKHVEDEEERDYSGLKVHSLSLSEKEKEEEQLKEQMAEQNGDMYKTSDGVSGPWKMQNPNQNQSAVEVEEEEEKCSIPEVKEEVNTAKAVAYKPPALRNASASSSSSSASNTRRNQKSAPQITSELHFPSLSSAAKAKYSDADKSFQSVKHGIRSKSDSPHGLQLDLENKFSALHQGD